METLSAWSRALRDPSLRNLPYKIETNEYGQIVMRPTKLKHGRLQTRIAILLDELMQGPGEAVVEVAVDTPKGVKVPDVGWLSADRLKQIPDQAEASEIAPEICVEVISRSNTRAEMEEKRRLYFEGGAQEMWTCDMHGRVKFFDSSGERRTSQLVPSFPKRIVI